MVQELPFGTGFLPLSVSLQLLLNFLLRLSLSYYVARFFPGFPLTMLRLLMIEQQEKRISVSEVYSILTSCNGTSYVYDTLYPYHLVCVYKRLITWFLVDRMLVVAFETTKAHRLTASRFILRVYFARHVV